MQIRCLYCLSRERCSLGLKTDMIADTRKYNRRNIKPYIIPSCQPFRLAVAFPRFMAYLISLARSRAGPFVAAGMTTVIAWLSRVANEDRAFLGTSL